MGAVESGGHAEVFGKASSRSVWSGEPADIIRFSADYFTQLVMSKQKSWL